MRTSTLDRWPLPTACTNRMNNIYDDTTNHMDTGNFRKAVNASVLPYD